MTRLGLMLAGISLFGTDALAQESQVKKAEKALHAFEEGDAHSWLAHLGDAPHPALDAMAQAATVRTVESSSFKHDRTAVVADAISRLTAARIAHTLVQE